MGQLKQLFGKHCGCWCRSKDAECHFIILKKLVIERLLELKNLEEELEKYPEKELTDAERKEIDSLRRALKFASHKGFDFEKKVVKSVPVDEVTTDDEVADDDEDDDVADSSENENEDDNSADQTESETDD